MNRFPQPRILVIARTYPSANELYAYPFVHRRILAYRRAGIAVALFRPSALPDPTCYDFDGVHCHGGGPRALRALMAEFRPDVIAVHGLNPDLRAAIEVIDPKIPVRWWLHGSEMQAFAHRAYSYRPGLERDHAEAYYDEQLRHWRARFERWPAGWQLVFVSNDAARAAQNDLGAPFPVAPAIIPNPIDTRLFAYRPKAPSKRLRILTIRPFTSSTYANDLMVDAILRLRRLPLFDRLQFSIIGDGPLFRDVLEPLATLPNVTLRRGFLRQADIPAHHARHGVFLVPSRFDTQGVSRDEAMSSGLVPITNRVMAIPEFVDEDCAMLADPDDSEGLARAIAQLAEDPAGFARRSAAAAGRIRSDRAEDILIPREIDLLRKAACA